MASRVEEFKGLWRASANEAVPYTDDFPEAILVTPELIDGSVNQGNATEVLVMFEWQGNGSQVKLTIRDNGKGIQNERRLLTWAAPQSEDLTHQNGHGLKKALTKYHQLHETAKFWIRYRRSNKNLQVISAPFLGADTKSEEVEDDEVSLMPSGTEISILFDEVVLKKLKNPVDLINALKELICTRYSEDHLQKTKFTIKVKKNIIEESVCSFSPTGERLWHSFKWHIQQMVEKNQDAILLKHHEETIPGGKWIADFFFLTMNGSTNYPLKTPHMFPIYGRKNQTTARVFIGLNGRTIEPYWLYKFMGKEAPHNDYNGIIGFVDFIPTCSDKDSYKYLPTPATTKVSFYENCPIFLTFRAKMTEICENLLKLIDDYKEEVKRKEAERKAELLRIAREEKAKQEAERKAKEKEEKERLAKEKAEKEKAEKEKAEKEKAKLEAERKAKEKANNPVPVTPIPPVAIAPKNPEPVNPTPAPTQPRPTTPPKSAAERLAEFRMKSRAEKDAEMGKKAKEEIQRIIAELSDESAIKLLEILKKSF